MGGLIFILIFYFLIFRFVRKKAAEKQRLQNRNAQSLQAKSMQGRQMNDYGSGKQHQEAAISHGPGFLHQKQKSERTGYERNYSGPGACADSHGYCSHISVSGKFKDFEDRNHDWLARQMEEERRALKRLNF